MPRNSYSDVSEKRPYLTLGWLIGAAALLLTMAGTFAAEVIPPKPDRYFNDYAHVVSPETALRLNEQLAQFERESSAQVVVAVFPKMQSDSSIDDYTRRIAIAWDIGQKETKNGAALFVFIQDRKMFIQTAHGVEGALPDATCFDITERHIKPEFRAGNYEQGLVIGVDLICKALRGEYQGSGKTAAERHQGTDSGGGSALVILIIFVIILIIMIRLQKRGGYRYSGFGGPFVGGWSGSSGGGGWSSGGGGGGGFSGFSGGGGGGGFGGGGAGSSW